MCILKSLLNISTNSNKQRLYTCVQQKQFLGALFSESPRYLFVWYFYLAGNLWVNILSVGVMVKLNFLE